LKQMATGVLSMPDDACPEPQDTSFGRQTQPSAESSTGVRTRRSSRVRVLATDCKGLRCSPPSRRCAARRSARSPRSALTPRPPCVRAPPPCRSGAPAPAPLTAVKVLPARFNQEGLHHQ
jgi:hypothetical protein